MFGLATKFTDVGTLLRTECPKEPVYCIFSHVYRQTAKEFLRGFPGRVLYAVKANSDPTVLRLLTEAGIRHFDCASLPEIERVDTIAPGLPSHPGHEIARRQMDGGFGGMLSIQVKGGAEGALNVAKRCKVFTRAASLGGVESLIEHRYSIDGERSPIPKDWLRLSIGIESVDDLIADLEQAFMTG